MHITKEILCFMLLALILSACTDDGDESCAVDYTECKVAVILPMDEGLQQHWQRTIGLCADNILKATSKAGTPVRIKYELYDEENADLRTLADSLVGAGDVTAVIGGLYSSNAKVLASRFVLADIPLFTMATSEHMVRAYSSWGNLWAMTETDITQCEVLLTKAAMYGDQSVALIAKDNDAYCQTFIDWFAFQAEELGLEDMGVYTYSDTDVSDMEKAFMSGAECVICVPSEIEDITPMLQAQLNAEIRTGSKVRALFSDTAYGAEVIAKAGPLCEGLEGVAFGADPATGFDVAYQVFFDDTPTLGEAHAYDACMLIGLAVMLQQTNPDMKFKQAMQKLVSGKGMNIRAWMLEDMSICAQQLAEGKEPNISGASGKLDFDSKVFTNVLSTFYYNFIIYNNQYVIVDYNSTEGTKRSDPTLAGWNWKAQQMQEFDNSRDITYPELDKRWALLVATSSGWEDYRHQADVLNMYQLLIHNGYDDNHIVLIMEDDIADNVNNPNPGVVRSSLDGENVRQGAVIDYHTSNLKPSDLTDILLGHKSDRLPEVIESDANDNVLIFWSGHGTMNGMQWLDNGIFDKNDADAMLTALEEVHSYRRLIWFAETCYSGGVACVADNHHGVLAITAANAYETSKADVYDNKTNTWLSNRFTSTLHDCLINNASISMRDLYYRLFQNTVGSHVCVFGASGFGNLYISSMDEFVGGRTK